jgi:hypothetical protein
MPIVNSLWLEDLCPGILRVVQHKRDELHRSLFLGVAGGVRPGHRGACAATAQQRKEVPVKYQAEDEQNQHPADADMHAAKAESATTAAFAPPIFNITACPARCPTHVNSFMALMQSEQF